MKLDPTVMRNLKREDFRVLVAVETGMKNHALVPAPLIASLAKLRHGGTGKILSALLRDKLLSHDRSVGYDGYRLTNSGFDILALWQLKVRKVVVALGDKIGTGKESDVYLAVNAQGKQLVLKFHRLGRTSFRDVKKKRDYFNNGSHKTNTHSWLFLSRMSALKEYAFMKALYDVGYPTPEPIGHSRHVVAMTLIRGAPLYQLHRQMKSISPAQAESIFQQSMQLAERLAGHHGLVHCDLNEFNLMVDLSGIQHTISRDNDVGDHYVRHSGGTVAHPGALSAHGPLENKHLDNTGEIITEPTPEPDCVLEDGEAKPIVTLIDFPQMVSTRHPNAQELFERDVESMRRFFSLKLKCVPDEGWDEYLPKWKHLVHDEGDSRATAAEAQSRLDAELKASGFSDKDRARDLELYYFESHQNNLESTVQGPVLNNSCDDEDSSVEQSDEELERLSSSKGSDSLDEDEQKDSESKLNDEYENTETKYLVAEAKARQRAKEYFRTGKKGRNRNGGYGSRNVNKVFHRGKRVEKLDLSY